MLTSQVTAEIAAERSRQDEQWGGPAHDDTHDAGDWCTFIRKFMHRTEVAANYGQYASSDTEYEHGLIHIAALAIAAIESNRRKTGRAAQ